ncbi:MULTISPECIES: chaplin [unclassified Streptomyces]|uniref:chaplin n=1 Tax=unclassified Streptomyces TaxID=2593676 RepID=UPI00381DFB6E
MRQVAKKGLLTAVATGGVLAVTGGMAAYADSNASGVAAGSPGIASGNAIQVPVNIPVNVCGNTINVVGLLNPAAGNTCVNGSPGHREVKVYKKGFRKPVGGGYRDKDGGGRGGSTRGVDSAFGSRGNDGGHGFGGNDGGRGFGGDRDGRGYGHGGASAHGAAVGSPGILSGNAIQAPVNIPVNACGNSVNVIGLLNPAVGNTCVNAGGYGGGHHYGGGGKGHGHHPRPPHRSVPRDNYPEHNNPEPAGVPGGGGPSLAQTGTEDVGTALLTSAGLLLGGAVLFRRARAVRR